MEDLLILLIALLGFAIIGGGIAGWIAVSQIGGLRRSLASLERQVEFLLARNTEGAGPADDVTLPIAKPVPARTAPATRKAPEPAKARPMTPARPRPVPKRPAPKPRPKLDLETLLGAKGSVWIGGLALLLGAVFLLRYTIEAGLLTPPMRLAMAALLGVVALAASELLARRDLKHPTAKALAEKADIPALLAAVGVFALFGTVYAAHALYGLLPTLPAFIGMAAVALGTMALSLRRGPWLAAIGLVGALAVPLLVASVTPSYVGVFAYVAMITAAAIWVARKQGWSWLEAAALAGATAWLWVLTGKASGALQFGLWSAGLILVGTLTLQALLQAPASPEKTPEPKTEVARKRVAPDNVALWKAGAWLGLILLGILGMTGGEDLLPVSYVLPFLLMFGVIIASWRNPVHRIWPILPIAAALFVGVFAIGLFPSVRAWSDPGIEADVISFLTVGYLILALCLSLVVLHHARHLQDDRKSTGLVIATAVATFFLVHSGLGDLSYDPDNRLALIAHFSLASLFAVAALLQDKVAVRRGAAWSFAVLWAGSIAAYLDAVPSMDYDPLALCALLALAGSLVALFIAARRDDPWVRVSTILLPGVAGLIALQALEESETYISTAPVLNELWLYFGLPGLVCAGGAVWLRRRKDDLASQALTGGAVVFGLLLTVLLIHHLMNGGDLSADVGFESLGVQLLAAFAVLLGSSWAKGDLVRLPDGPARSPSEIGPYIVPTLLMGVSLGSLALFALFQLLAFNPLFSTGTQIDGPPLFNALLIGYGLPTVLLGGAALRYAGTRPAWFVRTLGGLAGLSWLAWTTAQIRAFAQGPEIALGAVPWDNVELYAVSAVWLLTGLGLLVAGSVTKRRDLRLASAVLITLTVLKVFLVDMSELDGALRAVSFLGLGVALIGIGRFYQRILTTLVKSGGSESNKI